MDILRHPEVSPYRFLAGLIIRPRITRQIELAVRVKHSDYRDVFSPLLLVTRSMLSAGDKGQRNG